MRALRLLHLALRGTIVLLNWPLKRLMLQSFCGYRLDSTARIGLAWIYPRRLRMAAGYRIGALSLLNKAYTEFCGLCAGPPARRLKAIRSNGGYFRLSPGYVD